MSVAALELLVSLVTSASSEGYQLQSLREAIGNVQSALKALIKRVGGDESGLKNAGAWTVEKMPLGKLKAGNAALGRLEALEVLVLGIEGKLRLWRSLHVVDLGLNLPELEVGARQQMEAATRALA